jgi:serine/threonine-protein kinase
MISGRLPFSGKNEVEILFAHLREQPPALRSLDGCAEVPQAVEAYVHRLIQKSPADRFADATEALDALQELSASLMGSDATFRAAVTPQLAQAFMPSSSTSPGSTGAHRPPPRALKTDTGASLMALGPGSSAEMRMPPTSETVEPGAVSPPIPAVPTPARSLVGPVAAAFAGLAVVAALLWKSNADGAAEGPSTPAKVRVVIESIPPGLTLIDDGGRVLGASPVTLATAATTLALRARRGDALSEPVTLKVTEGQLLADFTTVLPAAQAPPVAQDATPVARVAPPPPPVSAPTPASPRPAARPSPPPASIPPAAAASAAAPPPRPSFLIEDDKPKVAPLEDRVGIGLLDDDSPRVAPLD